MLVEKDTRAGQLNDSDIKYVSKLAVKAGKLAVKMRKGVEIKHKSGPWDKVTAADLELSKLIIESIHKRFPVDQIISEEDTSHEPCESTGRVWLIDPIDGTDNYVSNDGQYSVMIGLLVNLIPVFGWVYAPASEVLYFGGPEYGSYMSSKNSDSIRYSNIEKLPHKGNKRLMMGLRDRKANPWVQEIQEVEIIQSGSIGLKVVKILDGKADMFIHLARKLKVWDTAGPSAIALGAGLEVGTLEEDTLPFNRLQIIQNCSVIIGRPGTLSWARKYLIRD